MLIELSPPVSSSSNLLVLHPSYALRPSLQAQMTSPIHAVDPPPLSSSSQTPSLSPSISRSSPFPLQEISQSETSEHPHSSSPSSRRSGPSTPSSASLVDLLASLPSTPPKLSTGSRPYSSSADRSNEASQSFTSFQLLRSQSEEIEEDELNGDNVPLLSSQNSLLQLPPPSQKALNPGGPSGLSGAVAVRGYTFSAVLFLIELFLILATGTFPLPPVTVTRLVV